MYSDNSNDLQRIKTDEKYVKIQSNGFYVVSFLFGLYNITLTASYCTSTIRLNISMLMTLKNLNNRDISFHCPDDSGKLLSKATFKLLINANFTNYHVLLK